MKKLLHTLGALILTFTGSIVMTTALAVSPVSKDGPPAPPKHTFGVKLCGEIIIWVELEDGKFARFDKDHWTPKNVEHAFLEWLDSAPRPTLLSDRITVPSRSSRRLYEAILLSWA